MADISQIDSNEEGMTSIDNDNRSKPSRVGKNRWSRVREAYQSGELDRRHVMLQPEHKRARRNALADISAVSTNANATSQKHQFHQLVERVRELQKEIVPDILLYQMPTNYTPFTPVTPSSNTSRGSISIYPHRQSISLSSASSNTSLTNQRFALSNRIIERAHEIPERFWIDWQQKQMQDRIDELEYIKKNMTSSSHSSLLSNEMDEDDVIDSIVGHDRKNYDEIRRKSFIFFQEAQRLANERRASLAHTTTIEQDEPETNEKTLELSDNNDHHSFNFDQRSEETSDTANLNDLKETAPKASSAPIKSIPEVETTQKRARSPISLPFTYINTQEQIKFSNNNDQQIFTQPIVEKVIEVNSDTKQTNSPTNNNIEDVAEIGTEVNLTLLKREHSKESSPILYSKAIVNRHIQFRSIPTQNTIISSKKHRIIFIPVITKKRKEIDDSRSSSPTLSFKSVRSRLSSIDNGQDLDDNNNNDLQSSSENQSMNNVYKLEQNSNSSSSSSSVCSIKPSEEKNNLSFSPTLFICRHRRQKKKKGNNASNLSLASTSSFKNNLPLQQRALLSQVKNDNNKNNNNTSNRRSLKIAHNTSVVSSDRTQKWKQNVGGFQHDVLTNDNSVDDDGHFSRRSSSSSPTRTAADCLIQRQRRKQTRLKRKTGSEKEKEKKEKKKKKKKKERNKKSPSSTTEAEATEASLFQFFAVDPPTIDTSAIFYPYEPARCADKSTTKEENCFSIQTSEVHHQKQKQQSKFNLTMADGHGNTTTTTANSASNKKKENVRVFVRRRRTATKDHKRVYTHSSSSNNSHETISSSSTTGDIENLLSAIEKQINNKQKKSRNNNDKNIIVVNYKPVFINSRPQQKTSSTTKQSPISTSKLKPFPTDDEFSSATHYSRRRSLTTTSSDGSPLRSTTNRSQQEEVSVPLDVPDIEDPLMFIEMMYQQLFTEDGRLRSGTEPTMLANCVKQIVTNSRRNSVSSSIANGSTSSHLKRTNSNSLLQQQRKYSPSSTYHPLTSAKPIPSLSSSPHPLPNEHYDTFSEEEEEEEEPNTVVQINNQPSTTKTNTHIAGRNLQRFEINKSDNHCQIHAYLNSCHQNRDKTTTMNNHNGFHFSLDDTDNEDLDTFSDLNSIRFTNKALGTSPSVDEDLTHTDSRLLSSSGYHSIDRPRKSLQKPLRSKSHSENDLLNLLHKNHIQVKSIHYCPNCIPSPIVTVIPPSHPVSSSSSNIIQRFQQPIGMMLMKYLNFILVTKNVLLLPLFIFLLRQRSMHI